VNLRGIPAEEPSCEARIGVLLLEHDRNGVIRRVSKSHPGSVPAGSYDAGGRLALDLGVDAIPRRNHAAKRSPVLPRSRTIKRMEIEQLERETCLGKNLALDSSMGPDKKGLDPPVLFYHCAGDRESRVKVPAGSSTREQNPHCAGSARNGAGLGASATKTF
jgi:hypothetical protein